jgi:hypothetical protein
VTTIVLLDTGPLGLLTNPRASPETRQCALWMATLLDDGAQVYIPEIADYELRRELLRANKTNGIERLDALRSAIGYVPLTTAMMWQAAAFWAWARQQGQPTADDKALDGDVILAAQARSFTRGADDVVIATTNVGHLARFAPARLWHEIRSSQDRT